MRPQTKLIKNILQHEFPDANIKVQFRVATTYVNSSDKIVVTIKGANCDDVMATLVKYTKNISVYRYGCIGSRWDTCNPAILDIQTNTWIDADVCEFIEVHT